jgi:hypothetical protein
MACEGSLFNVSRMPHEQLYEYINLVHINIYVHVTYRHFGFSARHLFAAGLKRGENFRWLWVWGGGGTKRKRQRVKRTKEGGMGGHCIRNTGSATLPT